MSLAKAPRPTVSPRPGNLGPEIDCGEVAHLAREVSARNRVALPELAVGVVARRARFSPLPTQRVPASRNALRVRTLLAWCRGHPRWLARRSTRRTPTADICGIETVRVAASFLVRGHAIKHVILLAHEGCGYYRARNPYEAPPRIVERQISDLRSAARWFRANLTAVSVELFYTNVVEHTVAFRRVEER